MIGKKNIMSNNNETNILINNKEDLFLLIIKMKQSGL